MLLRNERFMELFLGLDRVFNIKSVFANIVPQGILWTIFFVPVTFTHSHWQILAKVVV